MRKILYISLFLSMLLTCCAKKSDDELVIEKTDEFEINIDIPEIQNLNIIKYVNAPAGLRVRNFPDINADRIGILDDLSEILVVKEDGTNFSIDNIDGRWTFIETNDIRGWVFGGYLSSIRPMRLRENGNIVDIVNYFYNTFDLYNIWGQQNLIDFVNNFHTDGEPKISRVRSDEGQFGETITLYHIEYGPYRFEINSNSNFSGYSLISLTIDLSEEKYRGLFPFQTMEEYIAAVDFGIVSDNVGGTNYYEGVFISYFWDQEYNPVSLVFIDDLLSRIMFWSLRY